jgi:hypothetical protein
VSSRIHLTRSAVAATVCAVLALSTAGAAAAMTHDEAPAQGRAVATVALQGRTDAAAAVHVVSTAASVTGSAVRAPAPTTAAAKPVRKPAVRTVTIPRYADAPGSQRAIDACRLVLWTSRPLWLAGHNYCGYQWLAYIRTGTVVVVRSGRAAGKYVVTGHLRLSRQSGSLPRVHADLVLQTCVGRSTGLTLAHRLG